MDRQRRWKWRTRLLWRTQKATELSWGELIRLSFNTLLTVDGRGSESQDDQVKDLTEELYGDEKDLLALHYPTKQEKDAMFQAEEFAPFAFMSEHKFMAQLFHIFVRRPYLIVGTTLDQGDAAQQLVRMMAREKADMLFLSWLSLLHERGYVWLHFVNLLHWTTDDSRALPKDLMQRIAVLLLREGFRVRPNWSKEKPTGRALTTKQYDRFIDLDDLAIKIRKDLLSLCTGRERCPFGVLHCPSGGGKSSALQHMADYFTSGTGSSCNDWVIPITFNKTDPDEGAITPEQGLVVRIIEALLMGEDFSLNSFHRLRSFFMRKEDLYQCTLIQVFESICFNVVNGNIFVLVDEPAKANYQGPDSSDFGVRALQVVNATRGARESQQLNDRVLFVFSSLKPIYASDSTLANENSSGSKIRWFPVKPAREIPEKELSNLIASSTLVGGTSPETATFSLSGKNGLSKYLPKPKLTMKSRKSI